MCFVITRSAFHGGSGVFMYFLLQHVGLTDYSVTLKFHRRTGWIFCGYLLDIEEHHRIGIEILQTIK